MEDLASLTSMLLRLKGYQVEFRTNGWAGAQAVEALKPFIVLRDIGMPELNGYQTAKLIRQGEWGKDVTLVALSGYEQQEDIRQAEEGGFDKHFTKPIDITQLQA